VAWGVQVHEVTRRLTLVVTSLGHGGAQQQVGALAVRLARRGWEVDVVTLLEEDASTTTVDLPDEIPVSSLRMRRRVPDVRGVARLARHLRRRSPAVVHSHMLHANLVARAARPFSRVPVLVCTAHNVTEGGRWVDGAYRITDRWCDLTTNVSPQAVQRYVEAGAVPPSRIRHMPNGIDASAYGPARRGEARAAARRALGVSAEAFVWLNAGRHEPPKDLETLLRAFRSVVAHDPSHHLLMAGDGPVRADLEALAANLDLGGSVTFLGFRGDVPDLMRDADGFVMSSVWEGLPIVLLEAAASRLPTVATRVGGTTEVVVDGQTGRVVEPREPEALAAAMRSVAERAPEEREEMGESARRRVEDRFDLERVVDAWEEVYADLAERRASA